MSPFTQVWTPDPLAPIYTPLRVRAQISRRYNLRKKGQKSATDVPFYVEYRAMEVSLDAWRRVLISA